MKRLFIALNLPDEIKSLVIGQTKDLMKKYPGFNWVKTDGLHITLHFLGDCDDNLTAAVENFIVKSSGKFNDIIFNLGGLDAFPSLKNPRVLFLECEQANGRSVFGLYKFLQVGLTNLNFEVERRPWTPHITLARIKTNVNFPSEMKFNIKENFIISSFELMESELKPDGAEYKIVKSVKL